MNVDKESFASLMGLKEQLKVKQEEEARIAAEKEQKRKEAEAKAHEFENAMKELGVKKKIGREDKVFHAMPKPAPIPRQRYADEKAVLEDSLSDNISIDHLLVPMNGCLIGHLLWRPMFPRNCTRAHGPLKVPWIFTGTRRRKPDCFWWNS